MAGGKGPSGTTTSTQNTTPWSEQQPYLQDIFSGAQNLYRQGAPAYYPGQTYAQPTDAQNNALSDIQNVATGQYASPNPITAQAAGANTSLLNGSFLYDNPALSAYQGLAAQGNRGENNAGTGLLSYFGANNAVNGAPGTSPLTSLSSFNPGITAPGQGILGSIGDNAALGLDNPGSQALAALTGAGNPALNGPSAGSLASIAGNFGLGLQNPGSQTLAGLSGSNQANTGPGNAGLAAVGGNSNLGLDNPGSQALAGLAGSNIGAGNPGNSAFARYASGANVAAGNPNTQALTDSVLAQVVPRIQSQFIAGGALNSPEAARATAAGATSALAPSLFQNYQNEEANQLAGAQGLSSSYLQGAGLQGSFAQNLAQNALTGTGLQSAANQALNSNYLQGAGLQGTQAQALAQNALAGTGLQSQAGQALNNNYLQGYGLQSGNAQNLAQNALAGTGLRAQAGQNLNSGYLQGAGIQSGAASNLLNSYLTGNQQQIGAASDLGNQALQGAGLQNQIASGLGNTWDQGVGNIARGIALAPTTQSMPYTDLAQQYSAGQTQQSNAQQAINDAVQRYNYGATSPYQALNQYIGQVTGNYGGTTTLNQPYFSNGAQGALGSAAAGAQLGSMFLPGAGTAAGGLLGGLFGLFGGGNR